MNPIEKACLFVCLLSAFMTRSCPAQQPAAAVPPQVAAEVARKLGNTAWKWTNARDQVVIGGANVTKDGAWLFVRFWPQGAFSAWQNTNIVWEGRWEVIGQGMVRIPNRGPAGLVLKFDPNMTSFVVVNEEATTGRLMGTVNVDPVVGRWAWPRGGVVRLREDGRAFGEWPDAKPGVWRSLGRDAKYEIVWDGGRWIDTLRLMSGANKLDCKNQIGKEWKAVRVTSPIKK